MSMNSELAPQLAGISPSRMSTEESQALGQSFVSRHLLTRMDLP